MPVVIELTLSTKPGHYERALNSYLTWVDTLEEQIDDLKLVLIAGEPAQDVIHGIGVYDHAEVAEGLASTPFFAQFAEALEPHLAEPPDRNELELLQVFAVDTEIQAPDIGEASVVEVSMRAKLGRVDEMVEIHETFAGAFQEVQPDAAIILETVQRASGRMRVFVLYQHAQVAAAEGVGELVGGFYDAVEPLLAEPARRSELHIVHAFARG